MYLPLWLVVLLGLGGGAFVYVQIQQGNQIGEAIEESRAAKADRVMEELMKDEHEKEAAVAKRRASVQKKAEDKAKVSHSFKFSLAACVKGNSEGTVRLLARLTGYDTSTPMKPRYTIPCSLITHPSRAG